MVIIESVPQGILDHGVHQSTVVHPVSVTGLGNRVGSHGHVLHAACHNHIGISCHDHLSRLVHAVQTGAAYHVHGDSRYFDGQSRLDGCLTGHVLSLGRLDDASHVHLIHSLGLHACPVQGFLDYNRSQLCGGGGAQGAAHGADSGTAGTG